MYKGKSVWTRTRPWFRQHVLAEARGELAAEGDLKEWRVLARHALQTLQRVEAEGLIWEGFTKNRMLDIV